jgi:hypothetical protein
LDGLIIVDKPLGPTSHDVVARVRRILGGVKAGHCGTLDPGASGVLLVAVGRAARLFPFLSGHDKAYAGSIRFGFATDTYDAAGRPASPESNMMPAEEALRKAMRRFEGRIRQVPPAYSALKQDGQPLYKLARTGRSGLAAEVTYAGSPCPVVPLAESRNVRREPSSSLGSTSVGPAARPLASPADRRVGVLLAALTSGVEADLAQTAGPSWMKDLLPELGAHSPEGVRRPHGTGSCPDTSVRS